VSGNKFLGKYKTWERETKRLYKFSW
jgi:hypothetical protein